MTRRAAAVVAAVLVFAAMTTICAPPRACACSCRDYESTQDAVRGFDAVFVGAPTREVTRDGYDVYEFDVTAVYAGEVGTRVTVSTSSIDTACGTSFELDKEVLVFGRSDVPDGTFGTNVCTLSGATSDEVKAATKEVYGDSRPPDPGAPTASLPGPGPDLARTVGVVAGVVVFGGAGLAGFIAWWRRRAR